MADEQTHTPTQQTPEVKKDEVPVEAPEPTPTTTENVEGEKAAIAVESEEKKSEKLEEDVTANTKSPKQTQKRKSSKSRSRSNSANRGATSKEWKPKEAAKASTINANAPPFVSQQHHSANAVREEIQQARAVEEAQAIEMTEPGHYLNTPWTFWFSRKNKKGKAQADAIGDAPTAEEGEKDKEKEKAPQQPIKGKKKKENPHRALLTQLGTVNTVEEFWAHYCYLQKPSALPKESNYSFFRHKSEPMWETFPKGGCYIVRVKKHNGKLDQMWEELLFATIGESFEDPNVVGVVVSIRSKEDALSVWTKNHANPNRTKIGEKLKEILELDEKNTALGYKTNASSMRDKSTYKNAKKIILAS